MPETTETPKPKRPQTEASKKASKVRAYYLAEEKHAAATTAVEKAVLRQDARAKDVAEAKAECERIGITID